MNGIMFSKPLGLHNAVEIGTKNITRRTIKIPNTSKLIRQFIPKDTNFSSLSDDFILSVQSELNLRPRKLLNFSSPKQKFLLSLQSSVALRS